MVKIYVKSYTCKGLQLIHVKRTTHSKLALSLLRFCLCFFVSLSLFTLHLPLFLFLLSLVFRKNLRCTRIEDNQGKEKIIKPKGKLVRKAFSKPLFLNQKCVINLPLNFLLTREESLIGYQSQNNQTIKRTNWFVEAQAFLSPKFYAQFFSWPSQQECCET